MKNKLLPLITITICLWQCSSQNKKSSEVKSSTINEITSKISTWNEAHNDKDLAELTLLYNDSIEYYGQSRVINESLRDKHLLFRKYQDFNQQTFGEVELEYLNDSELKVSFIKRVTIGGNITDYPSYLHFTLNEGEWKISTESDLVTDKNIAKQIKKLKTSEIEESSINKLLDSIEGSEIVVSSKKQNIFIYKKLIKAAVEPEYPRNDQYAIYKYDLSTSSDILLFTTCHDGIGGTRPDYAKTDSYPMEELCGFWNPILSPNHDRLYFQTAAWATEHAIHYINLSSNKLKFYRHGSLVEVTNEGVKIESTYIKMKEVNGEKVSQGRHSMVGIYDLQGELIREIE